MQSKMCIKNLYSDSECDNIHCKTFSLLQMAYCLFRENSLVLLRHCDKVVAQRRYARYLGLKHMCILLCAHIALVYDGLSLTICRWRRRYLHVIQEYYLTVETVGIVVRVSMQNRSIN